MPPQRLFLIFTLLFSFFLVTFSLAADPPPAGGPDSATIEKATAEFMANICAGHGGVNCSVINKDASIVCNDGTIDESLPTIYAVPGCQKTLEAIVTQQSDFMAESGCFPPSEMACINERSYQSLFKHLSASGAANSELGKNELAQCREDISSFEKDAKNYKQCLINNGRPDFELSGKDILPILKTVFCPLFYGNNSSYDLEADLCLCDKGFFLNNNQCVQADKICREKYGPQASAKNGNCTAPPVQSSPVRPTAVLKSPSPTGKPTPSTTAGPSSGQKTYYQPLPKIITMPDQAEIPDNPGEKSGGGFIGNIISSFISGIKKMLKLF